MMEQDILLDLEFAKILVAAFGRGHGLLEVKHGT